MFIVLIYFFEVMEKDFSEFSSFEAWYKPIWDKLMDQFVAIVNAYKEFGPKHSQKLHIIDYLLQHEGKDFSSSLELELSVMCKPRDDFSELYEFHMIPPHAPTRSEVAKECCGLVLHRNQHQVIRMLH